MIIDTHAHYGYDDVVYDEDVSEEEILYYCNLCKIDYTIIQPEATRPYIEETMKAHDQIFELCHKYENRFFGMASINPHFKRDDYDRELIRCIKELGFVGVKIMPIVHSIHPSSKDAMHVYEISESLNIPVMVHTGLGAPFADPISMIEAIQAFPKIHFIIAHAGGDMMFQQALYIAKEFKNVYLEPSWLNVYNLMAALKALGAGRIMFSSDMPANIPVELAKYHVLTNDQGVLDQLLFKTAKEVFNLKI